MANLQNQQTRKFRNFELLAKQVVEGFIVGLHRSPFHGFSVEFAEHRQYNPGEDTKNIDWKVFARTEKLFSKKYEEETNLRCQVLIDSSSSMYVPEDQKFPSKFEFSSLSAASLFYLFQKQRDAFGLTLFHDQIEFLSKTSGSQKHFRLLLSELERRQNKPDSRQSTNLVQTLHEISETIPKRSLVVLFSDLFDRIHIADEIFSALQHLKFNKHEVILFHTVHKSLEIDFQFENRPYEFIDAETGKKLKLRPSEVENYYKEKIGAFHKSIQEKCLQYKIDYVQANIEQGFDQVLNTYLIKRKKMLMK